MSRAGPFMRKIEGGYVAHCPGCLTWHYIAVETPLANGARWSFNGDLNAPTFSPSLLIRTGPAVDPSLVWEEGDRPAVCHSFISAGRWEFCGDSTHALAGQTVAMPSWPQDDDE